MGKLGFGKDVVLQMVGVSTGRLWCSLYKSTDAHDQNVHRGEGTDGVRVPYLSLLQGPRFHHVCRLICKDYQTLQENQPL